MRPSTGGSYTRDSNGELILVVPPTGERPCKCRPDPEQVVDTEIEIPSALDYPQQPQE